MTAYAAARRRARDAMDSREDRGLPHHPDPSGWTPCSNCKGIGSFTQNDTNPYGYGPDPQCDVDVPCERCGGDGDLVDGRGPDLLIELRAVRRNMRVLPEHYRFRYESLRRRAMCPVSRLAQTDMLAGCQIVVNDVARIRELLGLERAA